MVRMVIDMKSPINVISQRGQCIFTYFVSRKIDSLKNLRLMQCAKFIQKTNKLLNVSSTICHLNSQRKINKQPTQKNRIAQMEKSHTRINQFILSHNIIALTCKRCFKNGLLLKFVIVGYGQYNHLIPLQLKIFFKIYRYS